MSGPSLCWLKEVPFGQAADFSEDWLVIYSRMMGVDPSELLVFCERSNAPEAQKIANNLGCTIILVPDEIMKQDHWALHHKQRHEFGMWSPGA